MALTYLIVRTDLAETVLEQRLNELAQAGGFDVICCIPGNGSYPPRLVLRSWTAAEAAKRTAQGQQLDPSDTRWLQME